MHYTVFDTPVIRSVFRWISSACLKASGWKAVGEAPRVPKCVIIAAFHTSNWDFPIGLFMAFALGVKIYWVGKDSLFRRPFGTLMRWLGGIPVNRKGSHNMVSRTIQAFQEHESLKIVIAPEGTRGKAPYWKTGFYHIALGARVPIAMAFLDYRHKSGGIGPVIFPTGDIASDMAKIRDYYTGVTARYPEDACLPTLKSGQCRKTGV